MEPKRKAAKIVALGLVLVAFCASACAGPIATYPMLVLLFPTSTIIGYGGGSLCSISALCGGPSPYLVSGVLLPGGTSVFAQSASFAPTQTAGTFVLSGSLADSAVLGGTMTINEVTGLVTTFSFTVGAPDSFTPSILVFEGVDIQGQAAFWDLQIGVPVAETPEPSSVGLIGTGLGLVGALLWFKRRACPWNSANCSPNAG